MKTAEEVVATLAEARVHRLRRVTVLLSAISCVVVTGVFLLMVIVDPPLQNTEVTPLQDACILVIGLGLIPGVVAVSLAVVGVVRKATRRRMWLPLAVSVALLMVPAIVGMACHMSGLFE